MHEHHFIQGIIEQVPNKDKVISIELKIGDLVGIEPDHLKEHLNDETNWEIKIFVIKSNVKCNCGYTGEARILQKLHDIVIFDCPLCGNDNLDVIEGKDIIIGKINYK